MRVRLAGRLDPQALIAALDALLARHQALRATFDPIGLQIHIVTDARVALQRHDLRQFEASAQQLRLEEEANALLRQPFRLETGPLFRAVLFELSDRENVLLLCVHRIVCDGWSWQVLARDLSRLYAQRIGQASTLEAPAQFEAYATRLADADAGAAAVDAQVKANHWLSRFGGGELPVLELPLDRPRPAVRSFNAGRVDHVLGLELIESLRGVGASSGASLMATMLAGLAATLYRISSQEDLVIGVPSAGQLQCDMPSLIGHCETILPIRVAVAPQIPFEVLVRASDATLVDDLAHAGPHDVVLPRQLPVEDDSSRLPLVSVLFDFDGNAAAKADFADLEAEWQSIPRRYENFELALRVRPVVGGLQVEAQFNSDLYDQTSVRRWIGMYECLLRSAVADAEQPVGRLDVLSEAEASALNALQPAPTPLAGQPLMHAAFILQAARTPERAALREGERRFGYRELDEQSNRLAHALRARGIGRGDRVGLCLPRSIEMFVALFAVLKAGAAYVPLDPAFPPARLDYYAEDARLSLLLTTADVRVAPTRWCSDAASRVFVLDRDAEWQRQPRKPLRASASDARPDDPAYVIYTSGSTGKPKGVCVPHAAVVNLMESMREAPGILASDRLAAVTTLSFDMAVPEVMLPLTVGAEIVIVPRGATMVGAALRELIEECGITVLQATPGTWRLLLDAGWQGSPHFKALIGAEPLPPDLAQALLQRCGELWNLYGPTETTVWSTLWQVSRARIAASGVSVGKPFANTTVWIVDGNGQRCPIGVPGEIVIGGAGVTLGYLNRDELTAERFIADPWGPDGARLYRTGDRGRWGNDGLLEHLGRFDFQVKVRGYRIELGEIEAACSDTPGVGASVVVTRTDAQEEVQLIAYLSPAPGARIDLAELDRRLRDRLPKYMLPQHVVVLDAIPVLPNGKVDRKGLPDPDAAPAPAELASSGLMPDDTAPRDEHERRVLLQFEDVLGRLGLGVHADFFAEGGRSLTAVRLAMRLSSEFRLRVPPRLVFEAPTAAGLAAAIQALDHENRPVEPPLRALPGRRHAPLTLRQERMRFSEELHPGRANYLLPSAHRLAGALEVDSFKAALDIVIARQPALRTAIGSDPGSGEPLATIAELVDFELPLIDLEHAAPAERERLLEEKLRELAARPMRFGRPPLVHAALFRLAADDHVFAFSPHRMIWDAWSFVLLQRELSAVYGALVRTEAHSLPASTLAPGDYAEWEACWLNSDAAEAHLLHWKRRFAEAGPIRALGTDMPRRAGTWSGVGLERFTIDASLAEDLRQAARRHRTTVNLLALSVFVLMLGHAAGQKSIVVAVSVRGREAAELEQLMGAFDNLLPIPFQIGQAVRVNEFIRSIHQGVVGAIEHCQLPFERLVQEPELARFAKSTGAPQQASYFFQDARERPSTAGGLGWKPVHIGQAGEVDDLGLCLTETADTLEGSIFYSTELYLPETARGLTERYIELLQRTVAQDEATLAAVLSAEGSAAAARLHSLAVTTPSAGESDADHTSAATPASAPLKPQQASLARIWAEALNIDPADIPADANFFDMGGDSLLVRRVLLETERKLGTKIAPQRYVFETLAQLSVEQVAPVLPAAKRGLLRRLLAGRRRDA